MEEQAPGRRHSSRLLPFSSSVWSLNCGVQVEGGDRMQWGMMAKHVLPIWSPSCILYPSLNTTLRTRLPIPHLHTHPPLLYALMDTHWFRHTPH